MKLCFKMKDILDSMFLEISSPYQHVLATLESKKWFFLVYIYEHVSASIKESYTKSPKLFVCRRNEILLTWFLLVSVLKGRCVIMTPH